MGSVFSGEFIVDSTNAINNDSQQQVEQTRVVCTLDRKLAIIKKNNRKFRTISTTVKIVVSNMMPSLYYQTRNKNYLSPKMISNTQKSAQIKIE
jgi:hypothetical protein